MQIQTSIQQLSNRVSALQVALEGSLPRSLFYTMVGDYVLHGCKVTEGVSANDFYLALDGEVLGDETHSNPLITTPAQRVEEYPNIALCYGMVFISENVNKTNNLSDFLKVQDPPGAGYGRYDVVYLYANSAGPAFGIQTGVASIACKDAFDATGLVTDAYPQLYDPALPQGVQPIARVYVQGGDTGIANDRIVDLRNFFGKALPQHLVDEASNILNQVIALDSDFDSVLLTAQTAATTATTKASEVTAALIAFEAMFLGRYAVDPTTDNQGGAILDGATYINTVTDKIRVYSAETLEWNDYDEAAQSATTSANLAATNAAASAASAEASVSLAGVQASAASGSASAALLSEQAALASEQAAAASETRITTAADTATTAANAALLSEQHALTSEQAALLSEQHALASEQAAGQSALNALASEQAAAASELAATTQAGIATTQAGVATTQAGAAANSATASATSATNALSSENAAELAASQAQAALASLREATNAYVDVNGNLIIEFSDATQINTGYVVGPEGIQGIQGIQGTQGIQGIQGIQGVAGNGISTITRTSGTGAPGTTDVYTITFTDATTTQFSVYNGADGQGSGDMQTSIYDPNADGVIDYAQLAGVAALVHTHTVTKSDVGLANVDNTSDLNKPISTAVSTALGLKADLVDGKVPSAQLPAYVDDVLEYANLAAFPVTGTSGVVYVAADTNVTYRWSGSAYVVIGSDLALGETASTAYRGDRGKIAYDHSQAAHAPSDAEANVQSDWNQATDTADDYIKNKPTLGAMASQADVTLDGKQYVRKDQAWSEVVIPEGGVVAEAKTSAFTAVNNRRYICDTSLDAFTCTLPATPAVGDYIEFLDANGTWNTNNLTIGRNGSLISGAAENLVCDTDNIQISLTYVSAAYGWAVKIGASTLTAGAHTTGSHSDWPSDVDMTEVGYLNGVTSSIQTQLNGKQASGSYATLAGAETLTNKTIDYNDNTITNLPTTSLAQLHATALSF